tara:strand:+ start:1564 stop:2259 length:696 start_codon:yes stop_codon:yes gene_type:complete
MYELPYLSIDKLDPEWCLKQCRYIINNFPIYEKANNSGKFFKTYQTYRFYKESNIPIIKEFVNIIENFSNTFLEIYPNKKYYLEYISVTHVLDSNEKICVWHKDRTYFDGQFHITVLGNGYVKIFEGGIESTLKIDNGTIWYLNGSNYLHTIQETQGERFEICAPNAMRRKELNLWKNASSDTKDKCITLNEELLNTRNNTKKDHIFTKQNWSGRERINDQWIMAMGDWPE